MPTINISEDVLTLLIEATESSIPDELRRLKKIRNQEEAVIVRQFEDLVARKQRAIFDAKEAIYKSLK